MNIKIFLWIFYKYKKILLKEIVKNIQKFIDKCIPIWYDKHVKEIRPLHKIKLTDITLGRSYRFYSLLEKLLWHCWKKEYAYHMENI